MVGVGRHARAAGSIAPGHSDEQIRERDAANVAASARRRMQRAALYQPLTGGIVHFFGYGESLSGGFAGVPVLSTSQPYDNLMIGNATRAASNAPTSTSWVPVGPVGPNGAYPFAPMVATLQNTHTVKTSGETPGEGAVNYFRNQFLTQLGVTSDSTTQFVLTNCAIGGKTIAQLSKGASPELFNRLRDAATQVQQTATSLGLSYQVGGMIWTHGEADVGHNTSYGSYLAALQQLQQDFLTDIVQTIGGQPPGVTVPWFSDQPDSISTHHTTAVYQALLDWSNTPGSDFYLAGPTYQYPDHSVHLTSNGYRWHGNQVGKAMTAVLLNQQVPTALYVASATFSGTSVLVNLNVPVPPIIQGDAYVQLTDTVFPNLGFVVFDSGGVVPIVSAAIAGAATVQIVLGRAPLKNPVLQAGYNLQKATDWGTNICDSDATVADDVYSYTSGAQYPGEDIQFWNGAPLIGQPYPLNNYLAVGQVPIIAE